MSEPRLIDANELKDTLDKMFVVPDGDKYMIDLKSVYEAIDSEPTAYSIDKIVDALKESTSIHDIHYGEDCFIHGNGIPISKAIEIVKSGVRHM